MIADPRHGQVGNNLLLLREIVELIGVPRGANQILVA